MYNRILIPLYGSKAGEAALPHVEELVSKLAPGQKVEVTLFHVLLPRTRLVFGGEEIPYTEAEMEEIKKKAMDYLDKAGEGLRSKGAIVKCKASVSSRIADELIKAEDEINADLVVMSTHGRHGHGRWALSRVTDKVLHAGSVPVLVVRAPKE